MFNKTILEVLPRLAPTEGDCGVEIEVEKTCMTDYPAVRGWRREVDNSLRVQGMEYVMSNPRSWLQTRKSVDTLYNAFSKNNLALAKTGNAGIHVHINMQRWTLRNVLAFAYLFYCLEDILVPWCGEDRDGNLFCLRGSEALLQYDIPISIINTGGRIPGREYLDSQRYGALNFASLPKFGSLEVRCLEFVTEPGKIFSWINILQSMSEFILKNNSSIRDIYTLIMSSNDTKLLELIESLGIFGEEFGNKYRNLDLAREACGRAFYIAYEWNKMEESNG